MDLITSRSNPKIKQARALRDRKAREETGRCLVEGVHHVGEAAEAGAAVEYICYAPDLLTSAFARDLIQAQSARGVSCYPVSAEVFRSIAEKENPQGILAVVRQPRLALEQLSAPSFPWAVALVAPQDPGNVGSILRTVDAVGASGLILLEGGVDPYHPSAIRAGLGAHFWYPIVSARFVDFSAWAGQHGYTIYGTSARGTRDYLQTGYTPPMILLLGSEQKGLSPEQAAVCHQLIRLPMRGRASSLNLAVAAGVMLYAMLSAREGMGKSS